LSDAVVAAPPKASTGASPLPPQLLLLALALAAVALLGCAFLWQRLSGMEQQLARQSGEASAQATQARATAQLAQELATDTAAKLAMTDTRLSEIALQRSQLEELMQSLSRSRDENLVVDIDSGVRLALQQSQLTGSVEPLMVALKSAELRIGRAAQPRLTPVQRAIARDVARIKTTALADTPALLVKLDELVTLAEDLPVANAVAPARGSQSGARKADETVAVWWARLSSLAFDELRSLVRISRIEDPDAALMSPEQAFFLRENLKLRLLNARLGLLSRQLDSARSDLATAGAWLMRYFDASSRKTQTTLALLQQVQGQMKALDLPRVDDTLAALQAAAAGR
jgi:uroporphyrin-3 C-methyltransferase